MMAKDQHIAIIGAGPMGLGAAYRLAEMGYTNFQVYERTNIVGGLATTERDDKGFMWDLGPHILFSHYQYFDQVAERAVKDWAKLRRESWIWIDGRLVPYPIQNNIRHLSRDMCWKALKGLMGVHKQAAPKPKNFREWIHACFGDGLAEIFMLPYNEKIWAWPTAEMDYAWIGDRVSVVDLESVLHRVLYQEDDTDWGPNHRFRFPAKGGIGAFWQGVGALIPKERFSFNRELARIDPAKKKLEFTDGTSADYDMLVSALPLPKLAEMCGNKELQRTTSGLRHSATHVVGLAIAGAPPEKLKTVSWIYFPDAGDPFYRATFFSNYSPDCVPEPGKYWTVLVEFSDSAHRPLNTSNLQKDATLGLTRAGILPAGAKIANSWYRMEPYGYPLPSLGRDELLKTIHDTLAKQGIYSRGRFGGWKYEVSNQDHSFMQGVELVNHLVQGIAETTYWFPTTVNDPAYAKVTPNFSSPLIQN